MNYKDPVIGGGIASLMQSGHGDVSQPGAFDFAQKSEPVVRMAEGGMAWDEGVYDDFLNNLAPDQNYTPPAQPVTQPAAQLAQPTQPQDGHYERRQSGEDIYDEWVANHPPTQQATAFVPDDFATSSFNWAKHGWAGGDPYAYGEPEYGGGESGNVATPTILGVRPEFANWLKDQGIQVVNQSRGANADYSLVKNGQVIDQYHHEPGWLDKNAPMLIGAALSAFLGPEMMAAFGPAGAGAVVGGVTAGAQSADLGDILKGAAMGGASGLAGQYINPAAASVGQSVAGATESELLGKIAQGAVGGAGKSGIGALLSGKDVGDALISGGLSGGVGSGVGSAVGGSELPDYLKNPATAGITAAILGKDPQAAAVNALIGQAMSSGTKSVSDLISQATATDTGDETARLLARAPADEQITEEETAPPPEITQEDIAALALPTAQEDVQKLLDVIAPPEVQTAQEQPAISSEIQQQIDALTQAPQSYDELIDQLFQEQPQEYTQDLFPEEQPVQAKQLTDEEIASMSGAGNLEQDFTVTPQGIQDTAGNYGDFNPSTGEWQPDVSVLEGLGLAPADQSTDVIATQEAAMPDYTQDLWTASTDAEQPTQEITSIDDLIRSMAGDKEEKQAPEDLLLDKMIDEGYGNLETDYAVTDKGTVQNTSTGEEGTFDENGNWVPTYTPPTLTTGTDGKTTGGGKTTAGGGTTGTKSSGLDVNSLLAMLALMGGQQQSAVSAPPALFNAPHESVSEIFKNYFA